MRIHISLEITLEIQKIHEFSISSTDGSIVVLEGQGSNWKARFPDCTARFLPCAVTGGCSFQKIPPKKSHPKKKTQAQIHTIFSIPATLTSWILLSPNVAPVHLNLTDPTVPMAPENESAEPQHLNVRPAMGKTLNSPPLGFAGWYTSRKHVFLGWNQLSI